MLYFLKQTANKLGWHIHIFWIQFHFTCLNAVIISRVTVCFITLPPLTLTSIKTTDVTHKYAQFLKIVILALAQERVIFIFSINSTFPCKELKETKSATMNIFRFFFIFFLNHL